MSRIGLALSGGGFRATLYHLGVLRFLRDSGTLPQISHITSVSGGSIMAAHLVMNWDRYCGSEDGFEEAANELLAFIRMDIRNRVVRRFPLASAANSIRWAIGAGKARRLTRPGLLEVHYERYLFGDKCLYELPTSPQLHMLATNVNEGCLCSFTRRGLLIQRRLSDGRTRFEPVPSALATIPMAVTASSAFPGFFPPLLLTAEDVGADESRFPPHVFTDGGVYDNLGVRMFRHIEESWIGHDSPLRADDFVDVTTAANHFKNAQPGDGSDLARLAERITARLDPQAANLTADTLPRAISHVIELDQLYTETDFDSLALGNLHADDLHGLARRGRQLDHGDHLWLNRCIVNSIYRQATGQELLRSIDPKFDTVIVSDAGKQFTVSRRAKGGGLVGTAMRASDIVMDRVWQLECDHFRSEPDFIFAPMKTQVHLAEDPTALHPELQVQVTNTRTDLDRFSELEISGLIRHGYGVMRKVARSHPSVFGNHLPSGPPWDPTLLPNERPTSDKQPSATTTRARELQESSHRKIFGRLFSLRDWPTYIYVPLLLLLLLGLPYLLYKHYQISRRSEQIVDAITFSNPDFQLVLELARRNPTPGQWETITAEQVSQLEPTDLTGFRLITDTRILDARRWQPDSLFEDSQIVSYRRMLVRRTTGSGEEAAADQRAKFRIQQFSPTDQVAVRSDASELTPVLRYTPHVTPSGETGFLYEAEFDLSTIPIGEDFEISFALRSPGIQGRDEALNRLEFPIVAPTDVATMWVLLPYSRPYNDVEILGYHASQPTLVETVEPTYRFDMADGSLFGWMIVAPRDNYIYDCRWSTRRD